jgi:hypothetical protein
VRGSATPAAVINVFSGANRAAATTTHVTSANIFNTTTGNIAVIGTAAIPANVFVWMTTTATNGTVDELSVTLTF